MNDLPPLLGESPILTAFLARVSEVAALERSVLVIGERGTGKELVAARLHYLSPRWDKTFVKLDCAALAPELLESELFGHEAGAFTGAARRHLGRFERASGGSLFLDEIANAGPAAQEKLLRAIEYGEYERVGGEMPRKADVRVIAATNVDLPAEAAAGRFRPDLLDRLAFEVLTIPPLRARTGDVPLLAQSFASAMAHELNRPPFPGFAEPVLDKLATHAWPGNVRELKNTVERAVYRTAPNALVTEIPFDPFASPWRPGIVAAAPPTSAMPALPFDFKIETARLEKQWLETALAACGHHQGRAAEALGLGYDQFRHLLKKHTLGATR